DAVAHLEYVGVVLLVGSHEDRALAVQPSGVGMLLGLPRHVGDVPDLHLAAAARADHGFGKLRERSVAARSAQIVAAQADIDRPAGHIQVLTLDRAYDLIQADARPRPPLRIEGGPHFRVREGPGLGRAHPGNRLEHVLEVFRLLFQFAPARGIAYQRHLHDADESRTIFPNVDLRDVGRQRGANAVEFADYLVLLLLGIAAVVELSVHRGQAVKSGALDLLDVFQRVYRIFDRLDDKSLHVGRAGARPHDADVRGGEWEGGVFGPGDIAEACQAQGNQQRKHHQGELPALDRECPD